MSKGMLGKLPLSEIRGPRDAFEEKLAGEDGEKWLEAFKRFLRKENPWPIDEAYIACFAAAITRCGCHYISGELSPDIFSPDVLGTLGKVYILGEPTIRAAARKCG